MSDYNYQYREQDEYCYPGTKVLINKLELTNASELHEAEREITFLRLTQLQQKPLRGQYGFSHLKAIHRYLFSDIYDWAGKIRRGSFLSKGDTIFCNGEYIEAEAKRIFLELASEEKLSRLSRDAFIDRLSYYMGEVNALHPFREGNGRTAREFFRELSLSAGYELDLSGVEKNDLLYADVQAFVRNYEPLNNILSGILRKRK